MIRGRYGSRAVTPRGAKAPAFSNLRITANKVREMIFTIIETNPGNGSTEVFNLWANSKARKAAGLSPVAIDQHLQWLKGQERIEQRSVEGKRYPGWFPKN